MCGLQHSWNFGWNILEKILTFIPSLHKMEIYNSFSKLGHLQTRNFWTRSLPKNLFSPYLDYIWMCEIILYISYSFLFFVFIKKSLESLSELLTTKLLLYSTISFELFMELALVTSYTVSSDCCSSNWIDNQKKNDDHSDWTYMIWNLHNIRSSKWLLCRLLISNLLHRNNKNNIKKFLQQHG